MKFWENGRFWIGLLVVGGAVAALLMGRISWDVFSAGVAGFLVRFGADKGTGAVEKAASKPGGAA